MGVGGDALGVEAGGGGGDRGSLVGGPAVEVDLVAECGEGGGELSLPGRIGPCCRCRPRRISRIRVMRTPPSAASRRSSTSFRHASGRAKMPLTTSNVGTSVADASVDILVLAFGGPLTPVRRVPAGKSRIVVADICLGGQNGAVTRRDWRGDGPW